MSAPYLHPAMYLRWCDVKRCRNPADGPDLKCAQHREAQR